MPKSSANPTTVAVVEPNTGNHKPPKQNPLRFNMVKLGDSDPVPACADSGAEITVISTATLKAAGIKFNWSEMPSAFPIRGVTHGPTESKFFITKLTFLHPT